jgi:hypothetical protein
MNTRPSELDNKTDPIGNKTDEASAAVGGIQVSAPLDATAAETTKFCTKQCTISSTFIVVIVYVLAIVSNFLVSVASGRFAGSVIGFLVGGLIPGIVVMIWFSEHMGGTSVDRCQIATVWFTMLGVLVLWSLGFVYFWLKSTPSTAKSSLPTRAPCHAGIYAANGLTKPSTPLAMLQTTLIAKTFVSARRRECFMGLPAVFRRSC